jgi:hypothetical protein
MLYKEKRWGHEALSSNSSTTKKKKKEDVELEASLNIDRDLVYRKKKKKLKARHQWLMPIILATREAAIRKIAV